MSILHILWYIFCTLFTLMFSTLQCVTACAVTEKPAAVTSEFHKLGLRKYSLKSKSKFMTSCPTCVLLWAAIKDLLGVFCVSFVQLRMIWCRASYLKNYWPHFSWCAVWWTWLSLWAANRTKRHYILFFVTESCHLLKLWSPNLCSLRPSSIFECSTKRKPYFFHMVK